MSDAPEFDAILILSFGGPEGPDEVVPFLENVTRGRGIPRERLAAVGEHYFAFGGVSPINEECRRLIRELETQLAGAGSRLPVYWGNRNWHPMLEDTLARMAHDGVRRAVAVATSAFSSYSACRQYLQDIDRARAVVGESAPLVEKIAPYWNHPGFIETMAANTRAAVAELGLALPRLVFTAHSIPLAMAATCDYQAELREACALVAERSAAALGWDLVYQSRSGAPTQPWLEPDVRDHLRALAAQGITRVVLIPIGFVADHMEVKYDLDTDVRAVADGLGLRMTRAATVGAAPSFVAGLRDLIAAHIEGRTAPALGTRGARPDPCRADCCAYVAEKPGPARQGGGPPARGRPERGD
ncbi:MAG: ferrochelatase [Deltaproteobacteria bacterium]|nr:ferrochelatase [Deltaproteobacteria bacterium]